MSLSRLYFLQSMHYYGNRLHPTFIVCKRNLSIGCHTAADSARRIANHTQSYLEARKPPIVIPKEVGSTIQTYTWLVFISFEENDRVLLRRIEARHRTLLKSVESLKISMLC
jgi:hypothetical protein